MRSIFLASLFAAAPLAAFGFGFRVVDHDPIATARAEAFTATADTPAAIYYNPAGITQLDGLNVQLGSYAISFQADYTSESGASHESDDTLQPVPHFFATWKPKSGPFTLGLGTYAPYGLGVKYDDDVPFRTVAKEGVIKYFTVNPVVALQLTRTLSVAAGPTVNVAQVALERGIFARGDHFRFEGEGAAIGFTAGILWQPSPQHSFGLKYHSPTSIEFSGVSDVKTKGFSVATPFGPLDIPGNRFQEDARADLDFPQFIVAGYSFRPTPLWNIELNVDWTDWDQLETVTLRGGRRTGRAPIAFNYVSSFIYEAGITRHFEGGYHVSAGYAFSENSVPESSFTPIVPDSDRHILGVGFGRKTDRWSWSVAYQFLCGPDRDIEVGTEVDGSYQATGHAFTLSAALRY
jgi:long-chain fatty acid transport protein